jgi:hypothetical protein
MKWHRKNSINGAYSKQDAATSRPVCQASTDPHREHRDKPILLGQQLTMDAFQAKSLARNKYCDLITDMTNHWIHPVFTRNRTAEELIRAVSGSFNKHPVLLRAGSLNRFIRCDPPNRDTVPRSSWHASRHLGTQSKEPRHATSTLAVSRSAPSDSSFPRPTSSCSQLNPRKPREQSGTSTSSTPAPHML